MMSIKTHGAFRSGETRRSHVHHEPNKTKAMRFLFALLLQTVQVDFIDLEIIIVLLKVCSSYQFNITRY